MIRTTKTVARTLLAATTICTCGRHPCDPAHYEKRASHFHAYQPTNVPATSPETASRTAQTIKRLQERVDARQP